MFLNYRDLKKKNYTSFRICLKTLYCHFFISYLHPLNFKILHLCHLVNLGNESIYNCKTNKKCKYNLKKLLL